MGRRCRDGNRGRGRELRELRSPEVGNLNGGSPGRRRFTTWGRGSEEEGESGVVVVHEGGGDDDPCWEIIRRWLTVLILKLIGVRERWLC